jgi:ABC-type microcin C transport system permease subunit YejE
MNVENPYEKLFARLPEVEPSSGLVSAILGRIERARVMRARLHASLHGMFILAAVIAFVPTINSLMASAAQSGFSGYISLISSDGIAMLGSWKSFILSVVETAPILEIGIVLALAFIFTNSLRRGARYISSMSAHTGAVFA